MTIVMFDSVDVSTIPPDAAAVAGYTSGSWPTYPDLVRAFPKAHRLSIAVSAEHDADCLDIEPGDAAISQAPAWVKRQQARGVYRPCLYTSLSYMPGLKDALQAAGIPRESVRLWVAHYTYHAHIEPGYDACQWTDRALGRNLDQSECLDTFFGAPAHPKPVDHLHYDWFPAGPFPSPWGPLDERDVVKAYDALRVHPFINRPRLRRRRDQLNFLAHRLLTVAYEQDDFKSNHRDWRLAELHHRAEGARVA